MKDWTALPVSELHIRYAGEQEMDRDKGPSAFMPSPRMVLHISVQDVRRVLLACVQASSLLMNGRAG